MSYSYSATSSAFKFLQVYKFFKWFWQDIDFGATSTQNFILMVFKMIILKFWGQRLLALPFYLRIAPDYLVLTSS